jgi:transposase
MRLISHSLQNNITSALLHSQKSYSQIASEFCCSKATISKLAKKVNHNRENLKGDMPKKLTAADERVIISQINNGKAENAVEVAKTLTTLSVILC